MNEDIGSVAASEIYVIEVFQASRIRRWLSAISDLVVAAATFGASGGTLVYGSGYRIVEQSTGRVVAIGEPEILDSSNTWSMLDEDLGTLTAAEFAERWL